MPTQLSRYRQDARVRIEAALAALPKGASRKDAEKAITAVNPYRGRFAGDGLCWASQCWSRERKAALRRRFPDPPGEATPGAVGYSLRPVSTECGRPWLRVECSWCGGEVKGGCLLCCDAHARVEAIVSRPEFRGLREEARLHPELLGVLEDWLEEQGIELERKP